MDNQNCTHGIKYQISITYGMLSSFKIILVVFLYTDVTEGKLQWYD